MHYDVFLSHNRRDAEVVEGIARRLQRAGMRPWLDRWELAAGVEWQAALADGLAASSSCAVFIGPHHLGSWEQQEVNVAVDRAAKDPSFLVFLVLLPGVAEPFDPAALSPFLSMRTWVDLRGGWDGDHAFQPLVNAVKGVPLGPPPTRRDGEGTPPYRGLQVFEEQHAQDFFGRDADVQRLLELLKGGRFVAVVGASGSGKSSLVRAGLVPALRAGALPGSERWEVKLLKPGPRPLVTLAASLLTLADSGVMQDTVARLRNDPESLDLAVSLALSDARERDRVLWVIDQAEELFTLCRDDQERQLFLENLLYAASVPGGGNAVVLTVRGDFYAMFGRYPPVAQAIASHQVLVGPMGPESLRQAIEEPARRAGVDFEDGLVATILQDVGGEAGGLPLLQEALLELWQRRRGRMLTLEAYQEAGRVEGAIAQRAEAVLGALTAEQQEVARRVLLRLTQPGEGTEDTRRRAPLRELREDGSHGDATEEVVAAFVEARMLVASADPATGEPWVEVSHEALIRGWPRLRDWIDRGRAGLRVHRRLTEAAEDWERSGRDEAMLYQGFRLAEAAEWLEGDPGAANEREREFVAAGLGARDLAAKRRRRRLAIVAAGLMLGIVLAGGAAVIAIHQRDTADRQRAVAESRALASKAIDLAPRDPQRSLRLAVEAALKAHTDEAENALRTALAQPQPKVTVRAAPAEGSLSPDGRLLLTFGEATRPRLWDARTGHLHAKLEAPGDPTAAAFSPSGRLIVAGDTTGATIWNAAGGLVGSIGVRESPAGIAPISDRPFSADERRLVLANGSREAIVYDLNTHSRLLLTARGAPIEDARFSPDGRLVAASVSGNTSRLWNIGTGRSVRLRGADPYFSPDGRRLLTTGARRTFLSAAPGAQLVAVLNTSAADSAEFSRDGHLVMLASSRRTDLRSAEDGTRVPVPVGGVRPFDTWTFSPDGRFMVVSPWQLRSATTGELVAHYRMPGSLGAEGAKPFGPDGGVVLTSDDQGLHLWPTPLWNASRLPAGTGRVVAVGAGPLFAIATLKGDRAIVWQGQVSAVPSAAPRASPVLSHVRSLGVSSDGRLIAALRAGGRLEVWRVSPWRRLSVARMKSSLEGPEARLAVSDDGRVVALMDGFDMSTWDTATGRQLGSQSEDEQIQGATIILSADGRKVAHSAVMQTATQPVKNTKIWDSRTGHVLSTVRGQGYPVAFSHDGRRVLTVGDDGTARVSDPSSANTIAVVRHGVINDLGATPITAGASLSPDGNLLTAVGPDRRLQVWDAASGGAVARLPLAPGTASVAFGPGNTIVAAGNGTVHTVTCEVCGSFDELLRIAGDRLVGSSK